MFYQPGQTGLTLDIAAASSMVAELAPIVILLRYFESSKNQEYRKSRPVIFLEEPESHLHPAAQIKLMRVFAELIKKGVKLIITTHSPYMFDSASLLIMEGGIAVDSFVAQHAQKEKEGSVFTRANVDRHGIEDQNFYPVSEDLFGEKLAILQELNECAGSDL